MRKPRVTEAMLAQAVARTEPIKAVETVRRERGRYYDPQSDSAFVRYKRNTVVFKQVTTFGGGVELILALLVPAGALVHRGRLSWGRTSKCRTEEVFVIGRVGVKSGRPLAGKGPYTGPLRHPGQAPKLNRDDGYRPGEVFTADGFTKAFGDCAKGVHFFETLKEARNF